MTLKYRSRTMCFSQRAMRHPWLEIPITDYEAHMALPSVGQAQLLGAALHCRNEVARQEVGAEPGLWLPWLLVEYA